MAKTKMFKKRGDKNFSWSIFFKKLLFWLLFIAFLGVNGWIFLFSDYTKIQKIEIITEKLDKKPLEDISNNFRGEFWFKYFSKNNLFLFPRKKLAQTLKDQFKVIRAVKFESKFPDTLVVQIEERQAIVIWCSNDKCFLLDETGLIFYQLQAGEKEGEQFKDYNIIIDNGFSESAEINQMIETGQLALISFEIKRLLKEKVDLDIERELKTPSIISKELRVETTSGWEIYFNLEEDLETQIELLKELLKSGISQNEKESLNYVDLRIAGRAIYNASFEKQEEKKDEKEEKREEADSND